MKSNEAFVIEPDEALKSIIKCRGCGMAYNQGHYLILKKVKKLTYFRYEYRDGPVSDVASPICHFCLKEEVLKRNTGISVPVVIHSKGEQLTCTFYASDK